MLRAKPGLSPTGLDGYLCHQNHGVDLELQTGFLYRGVVCLNKYFFLHDGKSVRVSVVFLKELYPKGLCPGVQSDN